MKFKNIINELNPLDYFIESKKITMLFDRDVILILQDFDNQLMFTFFVNRKLISAGVETENKFIIKFKKYLLD